MEGKDLTDEGRCMRIRGGSIEERDEEDKRGVERLEWEGGNKEQKRTGELSCKGMCPTLV